MAEFDHLTVRTDYAESAANFKTPNVPQDVQQVAAIIKDLDLNTGKGNKKKGGAFSVKKTDYKVDSSPDGILVSSWKMGDWDYKKGGLPTYARGLFTTRKRSGEHEIVIRGYDKFFNNDEVPETRWGHIFSKTRGPYELTLKENGCIIFVSGLEDDTLLVCSKHSTGDRGDHGASHAVVGERLIEKQLAAIGKTKADLARELRSRNATAVAELCDDTFEEHILAYTPDIAGLYLHGINLNVPKFTTYPSPLVQKFAEKWGFVKTGLIIMDDIKEVKAFLEEVAQSGSHDGRAIEGFVIRCQQHHRPDMPYHDWFFKYKFEEPYLMYRQWRECTKAVIAGRKPNIRKHKQITAEYLQYAKMRLAKDPKMGKLYQENHGIIALRDDFLAFKHMKGSDAAKMEELSFHEPEPREDVTDNVILAPIATIGCGKTTVALALCKLFGWGHIQNDNISGKGRPPRFVKAILDDLKEHPAVFADRNNAQRHERHQLLQDVKILNPKAAVVALHFVHGEETMEEIRRVTEQRVMDRGDNHQTIQAATDQQKFMGVMQGFRERFEPVEGYSSPDCDFDFVIELNPLASSRQNLETVVTMLSKRYPTFMPKVPTAEEMDAAMEEAIAYKPEFRHTIGGGSSKPKQQQQQKQVKPRPIEFFAVEVPSSEIQKTLEEAFDGLGAEKSRFYKQLVGTRRLQLKFHVTLMHRASTKQNPELWQKYSDLQKAATTGNAAGAMLCPSLGECDVVLERVVFDDRIMAIVVRLASATDGETAWQTVNKVAHITVGTRDGSVKPKESNDLLQQWVEKGTGGNIEEVVFEKKVELKGAVRAVLSR